jgi:DNA-binding response OmpR family regulator
MDEPIDECKVPTFSVRFESHDAFLVEYTDKLRHGFVILPLPEPLPPRSAVRLRVHLPDDEVLYLHGRSARSMPAGPHLTELEAGTRVDLDRLTPEQLAALERCVGTLVGSDTVENAAGCAAAQESEEPLNVLLVDDSVSQRIELGDALRARGLRVRVADNGLVGLSAALKKVPDVVLTDVEMPQMDGWGLLRSIRQRKKLLHVPIVFLTRLTDEMSRLRGYRMGIDDYLPKTMPPDEIVARIHGVLARRRQLPTMVAGHGLRGDLEHVRLGSVLSFLEQERRTGALHVRNGSERAILHVVCGALAGVEHLGRCQHPHDRVFELLDWVHGSFELVAMEVGRDVPANDDSTPLSYLLMEHARRSDEDAQ